MNAVTPTGNTLPVNIDDQMKRRYLDYAMSVIVSRALPDVRDGLKPVHRRLLYAMQENGYLHNKAHKKSARIVGDVMGKYHPHGDSAIYDAMVRMAQPWSMGIPLIDGQGNFGSMDGDAPAAMRYTESRMTQASELLTADIDMDVVDWSENYDQTALEPKVLPARVPNVLVNGNGGIAVGMATNIPPHNLGDVVDACLLYLDDSNVPIEQLMDIVKGPDFPTGGVIVGKNGIRRAYMTGRGSITVSGVAHFEDQKGGRTNIVITEFPYQTNKAAWQEKLAELVNERKIEGISDIRDESDRRGVRVVIELKRDADPELVMNHLKKKTTFLTSYGYNATCLDSHGMPREMSLRDIISEFVAFRRTVVRRRTIHLLNKARDELATQIGMYAAVTRIDDVVKAIRSSADVDEARERLLAMEFPADGEFEQLLREADPDLEEVDPVFRLSPEQVGRILMMNLRSLTGMEREKIAVKARDLSADINWYIKILNSREVSDGIIRDELNEVKAKLGHPRRTAIEESEYDDIDDESLIERKDLILTLTRSGWVKTTDLDLYRQQGRGGKGRSAMETKADDIVTTTMACQTHSPLVFFSASGLAFGIKGYKLPEAAPNGKGRPIVNVIENLRTDEGDSVSAVVALPEDMEELQGKSLVFVTDFGKVRRSDATDFANIRRNGKIAIDLQGDDGQPIGRLVTVLLCDATDDIFLATARGHSIRFRVGDLEVRKSRKSTGVKGISLKSGDRVIAASLLSSSDAGQDEREAFLAGGTASRSRRVPRDEHGGVQPHTEDVLEWGTVVVEESEDGNDVVIRRTVTLAEDVRARMNADQQFLLTVSERGYGKRSSSFDFRTQSRAGGGISCMDISQKTGDLVGCFTVTEDEGIFLITDKGRCIRLGVEETNIQGRSTRGVKLFNIPDDEKIVGVAPVISNDKE